MKTGFKGLAPTVMAALICAAFASCTALGPSDEPGAGTSDLGTGSPDLAVTYPSVSNSAPGVETTFTVSALVRNDGDEASAVTTMRFYRSADATITTSDTEVGTDAVAELALSGISQSATISSQSGRLASTEDSGTYYYHGELELNAPSTPGTYYFGACVDSVKDESDTTNNCSSSAQVTVRSGQQVEGNPDLNPYTIVVASGLVPVSPGGSFSLSVGVRNDGNGSSAATTLRYYRSTDATFTASDTEVGTDDVPSLAPSATSTQSISLTVPSTPGTYNYGACVDTVTDESDTTNNCSSSIQFTVSEPAPDLVVSSSVTNSTPAAGSKFTLRATVRNDGDKASAAATLGFYRSTDATITSSDVSVGTVTVAALAASGGTISEFVSLTAPSIADTYYYGACVESVTGESDTTNNCSASVTVTVTADGPAPDLVVLGPGVGSGSRDPGETFRLLVTVHNQGDGGSAATMVKFYRSTDAAITASDTLEGTEAVSALAPSTSAGETILLTAPSTAGTYHYGACVDAVPRESDTTNNCSTSVQVTVPRPEEGPAPDLVVGAPSVTDNELDTGETFTLSATVTNDGDEASAATTLRYYRSTDELISASDTQEDTDAVAQLAASGTSSESVSLTAPSTAGIYYYGACVDSVTGESDTTNNCSESVPVDVTES